jgi:D-alanyl-D-alanine carboxypeptidase/D-alanyl-D-alanine-endopeptidase (penicillin-binding protein 4)
MTSVPLPRLKTLSILIAFVIISSTAFAVPASATPKARRTAVRSKSVRGSVKKSVKGRSRSSQASARRRGSRSTRVSARYSRRGGQLYATRDRRGRLRWRRRVVTASVHGVGVHNYLSESWTQPIAAGERASAPSEMQSATATANSPTVSGNDQKPGVQAVPSAQIASSTNETSRARVVTNPGLADSVPVNPLVAAYLDSLAAYGYGAENQGFIVTTLRGEVLGEHNADRLFNPASVTKIATSLTAISRLGPDFSFRTAMYTDGKLDPSTGILHGSLYVIGSGDPAFFFENAMMIADKLNRSGIREVDGNLVVLGQFYFNFSASREASAKALRATLNPESWSAQTRESYSRFLAIRAAEDRMSDATARAQGDPHPAPAPPLSSPPSLKITGQTITDPSVNTSKLTPLAVHTSLPLLRVLKGLNDFSNNWMATIIGNLVGGPDAVERFLKTDVGFKDDEVRFATSSGLGANAISPRNTITMLRKLITYLDGRGLALEDILPIAGVDAGTLSKRFNDGFRGSVVAKTGTLSGVSALAGVAYTRGRGPLLFVIYNRGGSAHTFRAAQDETIKKLITLYGGPSPVRGAATTGSRIPGRSAQPGQWRATSNTRY